MPCSSIRFRPGVTRGIKVPRLWPLDEPESLTVCHLINSFPPSTSGVLARLHLKHHIPYGLHGSFTQLV
ncbi:MAG TPA: hypothetical protein DCE56_21195 [Cyanobacteria bacterium UBA8553]|nr:hypothetical protein [Cyanobacteria bacterium UBA8553]